MWIRSNLKERAKENFNKTYFKSVLISLVLMLITGGSISFSRNVQSNQNNMHIRMDSGFSALMSFWGFIGILFSLAVFFVFRILACNPLQIGAYHFFLDTPQEDRNLDSLLFSFRSGFYFSHAITLFKRDIFISLWTLLLVVPGIVKSYEYRMIPFLLAAHPDMTGEEAFQRSREMMDGQKWETFILDCSFIGWYLLTGVTCGLAGIFYVNPYYYSTCAELYKELS